MKIGDSVGGIYKTDKNGLEEWYLCEDKISRIVENGKGKKYYVKSKRFYPLDAEDVDQNTIDQEKADGYIITREVFGLNDITRPKAENWIKWANENMDKAVGLLS